MARSNVCGAEVAPLPSLPVRHARTIRTRYRNVAIDYRDADHLLYST
jgi:hypothetical protein